MPQVKAEIGQKLKFSKAQLEKLGPSRTNKDQQFQYLLELANRFQTITSLALKAHYGGDDVFDQKPTLKLATAIIGRNNSFSDDVALRGHTMTFEKEKDESISKAAPVLFGQPAEIPASFAPNGAVPRSDGIAAVETQRVRYHGNYGELEDILIDDCTITRPKPIGIKPWLEGVYRTSRGFELGTFDASILPIVWKKQSANWDALALGYISDIVSIVHGYTLDLLQAICEDERILVGIGDVLFEQLLERYKKAIDHTRFVLSVERSGTPLTMNHYFTDNLEKR